MYVIENKINSSGSYKTKKGYFSIPPFDSVKVKEQPLAISSGLKCYEILEQAKPSQEEVQKNGNKNDSRPDKH